MQRSTSSAPRAAPAIRSAPAMLACAALGGVLAARDTGLDDWLTRFPIRPVLGEPAEAAPGAFTFLVGGHLYGAIIGRARDHIGPAPTLRNKVDELAALEPRFFVSLGDLVRSSRDRDYALTFESLEELGAPVYNAVGNHDVVGKGRAYYEERFGRTFGGFRIGTSLFLVLDTELEPWHISGKQLDFLLGALQRAPEAGIENAFVFAHRVLFACEDERWDVVFRHANSKQDWKGSTNFAAEVRPALEEFARHGGAYWFSGDVGVLWSYGLFHARDEESGVTYVATGLGTAATDNVVRVDVAATGVVRLERIALVDPELPALEDCDAEHWTEHFEKKGR